MRTERKGKRKNQKGITLIGLVVTIIVLLILAGVSIATLTGENGILTQVTKAKKETEIAEEKESLQMIVESALIDSISEEVNKIAINNLLKYLQLDSNLKKYNINTIDEETGLFLYKGIKNYIITSKGEILEPLTAEKIADNANLYYGGVVNNYTCNIDDDISWKIFFADENNIYLITDDYVQNRYIPKGINNSNVDRNGEYKVYFKTIVDNGDYTGAINILQTFPKNIIERYHRYINANQTSVSSMVQAVAYLLDINVWRDFMNSNYAEYSIGGPTIEMYVASYNKIHVSSQIEYTYENYENMPYASRGYAVKWAEDEDFSESISSLDTTSSLYFAKSSNADGFWISSSSCRRNLSPLMVVCNNGKLGYDYSTSYAEGQGIRPLVCLKSNTFLYQQNENEYKIYVVNND